MSYQMEIKMRNKTWLIGAIGVIISIIIIQSTLDTSVIINTLLAILGIISAFIVLKTAITMLLGDEMQHIKKGSDPMEELFHEAIQFKYAVSKLLTRILCCIILIASGYLLLIHLNADLFAKDASFGYADLFAEGVSLGLTVLLPVILLIIGVVELYHTFRLFVSDKRVFLRLTPSGLQRNMMPFIPYRHDAVNAFIKWENISDVKIKRSFPFGTQNIIVTASTQAGIKTRTRTHKIKIVYSEQSAEEIMQAMEWYVKPKV